MTEHPFNDLDSYNALPRLASLALSPDGTRLVTAVSELAPDGKSWRSALWQVDPAGERPAQRLTRAAKGEGGAEFTPDGSLLFVTARADTEAKPGEESDKSALWLLPPTGEARQVYGPAGGVSGFAVAERTGALVVATDGLVGAELGQQDKDRRKAREDAGVTAILHEDYPVRHWDSDLGPDRTRLVSLPALEQTSGRAGEATELAASGQRRVSGGAAISPDGRWVAYVADVDVSAAYGERSTVRLVGTDGAGDRLLAGDVADRPGTVYSYVSPVFMPDSNSVLCMRCTESTADGPPRYALVRVELDGGQITELAPDFPHWPEEPVPAPDGSAVYFASNERGRRPLWRLDLGSGEITRLTEGGAFTDLCVAADGSALYALRATIAHPAQPVRLDPRQADQTGQVLPAPGAVDRVPGTLTEVETTVADGRTVRAWLAVPEDASADNPAPLLLWVHGGPLMSWNSWSWRWNPWLAVARGYAVLLPDPALSTGYGQEFIEPGWGAWGGAPFTDLMAVTDATVARPEIDATRTAVMGGSFGGYMANWIATQTDRFNAIVTHASLWNLDAFTGTTDYSYYWIREMGDPLRDQERIAANSPHLRVADIVTPMLVIHGDKDYRVPVGEGMRLYFDLLRHGVRCKYLYFPTENHWVLTPGNSKVWYETVFAWLSQHVHGKDWQRPDLL
ncbi:S9 family peptidase [Kutzneria viridogrisea]|uniref:Peptidase S9 prolyl oligopeptidase catalytic domain-containing protein n=2 Tax=Kutzneria TaxID=43356 RepID=W5WHP4_9PSEU|nr:S9 family peptidase [Kutzneria albida]AHI00271.1 hypothetical protein KALB_6912 [Kutzneria albida DSM 43870]MBA8925447.1 dipeptidyl aminopeptidase/acylaminoacyl peptidase [Kutzneria viridogrisea]